MGGVDLLRIKSRKLPENTRFETSKGAHGDQQKVIFLTGRYGTTQTTLRHRYTCVLGPLCYYWTM